MRYFIPKGMDLYEAITQHRVEGPLQRKPKPWRNWIELTREESLLACTRNHDAILLHGRPNYRADLDQMLRNRICQKFPELAAKHGFTEDISIEFWR